MMKKSILLTILVIAALAVGVLAFSGIIFNEIIQEPEQQGISVAKKIRSFMLVNNPEDLEKVKEADYKYNKWIVEGFAENQEKMYHETWTDEQFQRRLDRQLDDYGAISENSFCFYPLRTIRYAKQYADSFVFDELISENKYWVPVPNFYENFHSYDENYNDILNQVKICDKQTIEFLRNPEAIEQMVKDEIDEKILDCKIVVSNYLWINPYDEDYSEMTSCGTILYLNGEFSDYGIVLYVPIGRLDELARLENYKIYKMSQIIQSYADYAGTETKPLAHLKPTYTTEANTLQAVGLLNGNDRGLDLLKPLTRIEATTILVRALGLENEQTSETSQFTDIASDNWGAKYANIAADHGITQGIGDNKFAPNDIVTDNQFAALVLRSVETQDFDWQQAINILIERNIITQEQAETMDLFTRGDMAKIIYEAKQKGLIR